VPGVGRTKLERYGEAFLAPILAFRGEPAGREQRASSEGSNFQLFDFRAPTSEAPAGGAGDDEAVATSVDSNGDTRGHLAGDLVGDMAGDDGAGDDGLDTVELTRELILAGNSPEAVARARNLKVRTVEGHLAELVQRGELTAEEATGLPREAIDEVEAMAAELIGAGEGRLKPLYERLSGRYTYAQLRCIRAALE
jgi:hypothetical protein